MIVIGLDMATIKSGFAVVRDGHVEKFGVISAPASWHRHRRLGKMLSALADLMGESKPDVVALEGGVSHNARAALAGGESRGIALAAIFLAGVPWTAVDEIPPLRMKKLVTGSGKASKEEVRDALMRIYSIDKKPPLDASDAIGIAFAAERLRACQ